jgi:hypothetical protein
MAGQFARKYKHLTAATGLAAALWGGVSAARAQAPMPAPAAASALQPGAVVRRVVMKDALSAEQFRTRLESFKANGLFRDQLPGLDPKKPVVIDISFLTSGNYLLVVGSKEWVDANVESIRLMGFLFERPRAHLQLNLRVVQLTGPANAEVIQMSETVRALVDAQREEVVRTFSDLEEYLMGRIRARQGSESAVHDAARELLPGLASGERPLTVPEILLLLMLDRTSPSPRALSSSEVSSPDPQDALLELPRVLALIVQDPHGAPELDTRVLAGALADWKKAVAAARDWCERHADELKKGKDSAGINAFREALQEPQSALPSWLARRLLRSLELTERLYPNLARRHTEASLRELERRFSTALERAGKSEAALAAAEPSAASEADKMPRADRASRGLLALKSLAEELIPAPLALFDSVSRAADNGAPGPAQLIQMFREYSVERRKLEERLAADVPTREETVNYSKLQTLEAGLNLWLRRVSEAMARSLEAQFYRRYVNEIRLLANKELGKGSGRDLLTEASIDEVPDLTRDLLLADSGVNIFLSNSISLQFAPDTTNSVAAQVQASLPSKQGLLERVQQAQQASGALDTLSQSFGINGEAIVAALLAGGQAVPVQSGVNLSAMPSIGFDASTVTLSITANQTLQPNSEKLADRVTNHTINNATVTALSYEPMVLSTLASNISYYDSTGGIPLLRKTPVLKDLLKDIPVAPFKQGKRQKGVYQSSVLILEPVVIPTIEDLVRFHHGWRDSNAPSTPLNHKDTKDTKKEAE